MGVRLIIPDTAVFDEDCTNILKSHLCNYIIKSNSRYLAEGFIIYIGSNYLKIKYNHHYYYAIIIKEENIYYWHLKPYNKSFYTTCSKTINSFEFILMAIKENDEIIRVRKHRDSGVCKFDNI